MPEYQQTKKTSGSKSNIQKQTSLPKQIPTSHPAAIIQRARINPQSLTHADVMQLQRTIGNQAVVQLFSEIGLIPSKAEQTQPVQMQTIPEEEEKSLQGKFESVSAKEICPSCIQRQEIPEEEEPLQGKMNKAIQLQEIPEEEEPLQGKFESIQRQEIQDEEPLQTKRENNTGMPDNLKTGVENLSGIDMSDVRVHYNSAKPADVGALAYTQETDIHVAPGQEQHLPHEAWHVVQQKQGRVRPTVQLKGMVINNDVSLEREADVRGKEALQMNQYNQISPSPIVQEKTEKTIESSEGRIIQRHESGDNPSMVYKGKNPKAPHFDEENRTFRSWLAAYYAACIDKGQLKNQEPIDWVKKAMTEWCTHRKNQDCHFHFEQIEKLVKWIKNDLSNWNSSFWKDLPPKGLPLDDVIKKINDEIDKMPPSKEKSEDEKLLNALKDFKYGEDINKKNKRENVRVRPATMKALQVNNPEANLNENETNWAPTGTFTGGGGPGLDGKPMPYNIMVSRSLTTPKDVLLALLFESENVLNWEKLTRGDGKNVAEAEYNSFSKNQETLKTAYGAKDQRELCILLGVNEVYLGKPEEPERTNEGKSVVLPLPAKLREPTARNALWWFKTEKWKDEIRKKVWIKANHGEGMASSVDLYSHHG